MCKIGIENYAPLSFCENQPNQQANIPRTQVILHSKGSHSLPRDGLLDCLSLSFGVAFVATKYLLYKTVVESFIRLSPVLFVDVGTFFYITFNIEYLQMSALIVMQYSIQRKES